MPRVRKINPSLSIARTPSHSLARITGLLRNALEQIVWLIMRGKSYCGRHEQVNDSRGVGSVSKGLSLKYRGSTH
jgi:hypothetical protein